MTRHQGFDVRIAPGVDQRIRALAHRQDSAVRQILGAQDRLTRLGTRAPGAKKLRSLDLWEIRAGTVRLFFCPVPGTNVLAVGVLAVKTTGRIRMTRLNTIERTVHRWRSELEASG